MNEVIHNIAPVWDKNSEILILGSFPSVKSREEEFFYAHPQNRFWRVLAALFEDKVPVSTAEKKAFLLSHGIALWDVTASCEIIGSSDNTIKNAVANDINPLLNGTQIKRVFVNGSTAAKLYERNIFPKTGIRAALLPSTSPANASWPFDRLCEAWKVILSNEL